NVSPTAPIDQDGTLSGTPLAIAAGYETLCALHEDMYAEMNEYVDQLVAGYEEAIKQNDIPNHINLAGSMIGVFFTIQEVINFATAQTSNLYYFTKYYRSMIDEGIFLPPSQFEGLFMSAAHTDEDIEKTIEAVHRTFKTLKE